MTFKNIPRNKKGAEDLATWMIAFLFIVLIYLVYLFFVLLNYGSVSIFGSNTKLVIEERQLTSLDHQLFLLFLNTEIASEQTTVVGGIKKFLEVFFEIKNDKGETFIDIFGVQKLKEFGSELQRDMHARGFDDDDWQVLINAQRKIQESELITNIIELLNKDCNNYFLKIPFGVVTSDGLKNIDESVFEDTDAKLLLYTPTISYTTYYRGERIELKFRKSVDCI